MVEIDLNVYPIALFTLMVVVVISIIVVLFHLQNSNVLTARVKSFTLYFMCGLIGWVLSGLTKGSQPTVSISVDVVFYSLTAYLLFLAIAQGRAPKAVHVAMLLSSLCITLSGWMLETFVQQIIMVSVFGLISYAIIAYYAFDKAKNSNNLGESMIAFAIAMSLIAAVAQIAIAAQGAQPFLAFAVGLVNSSARYLLIGIGFISSLLIREHHLLESLALRDPLTNTLNRRGLINKWLSSIPSLRAGTPISAISIDIDYFKKINDSMGHDAGDSVLKSISEVLQRNRREEDIVCRFGGEEFVIILFNVEAKQAARLAEIIRKNVENLAIEVSEQSVRATISAGISTREHKLDIDDLLKEADEALYTAKSAGRNCVHLNPKAAQEQTQESSQQSSLLSGSAI
ncbi:MAG: GGDEF domain-containing protein [Pseudohongiellaceae bacterium]|nr:GGDEF domain-containing protein [Pseudohongiellaceae bacterium]